MSSAGGSKLMTFVISTRSRPRAASSVATSTGTWPERNRSRVRSAAALRHVAVHRRCRDISLREPSCEPVGATLRPHEHEREPVGSLEMVDEHVELVGGRHRDESVVDDERPGVGLGRELEPGGSRVYSRARSPTSPSSVAEKNIVWRSRASRRTIASTWGLKPMSSIRSASSRTSASIPSSETSRRSTRSFRRPGVATRMSAPLACLAWRPSGTPPYAARS